MVTTMGYRNRPFEGKIVVFDGYVRKMNEIVRKGQWVK